MHVDEWRFKKKKLVEETGSSSSALQQHRLRIISCGWGCCSPSSSIIPCFVILFRVPHHHHHSLPPLSSLQPFLVSAVSLVSIWLHVSLTAASPFLDHLPQCCCLKEMPECLTGSAAHFSPQHNTLTVCFLFKHQHWTTHWREFQEI